MRPGAIQLTRMLWGPHSAATLRHSAPRAAGGGDPRHGCVAAPLVAGRDQPARPGLDKPRGDRGAGAARRAGDDSDLAGKIEKVHGALRENPNLTTPLGGRLSARL